MAGEKIDFMDLKAGARFPFSLDTCCAANSYRIRRDEDRDWSPFLLHNLAVGLGIIARVWTKGEKVQAARFEVRPKRIIIPPRLERSAKRSGEYHALMAEIREKAPKAVLDRRGLEIPGIVAVDEKGRVQSSLSRPESRLKLIIDRYNWSLRVDNGLTDDRIVSLLTQYDYTSVGERTFPLYYGLRLPSDGNKESGRVIDALYQRAMELLHGGRLRLTEANLKKLFDVWIMVGDEVEEG
ncbi:hypothetical protein M1523_01960 [Patescibacteria group bacterium]|nr:hypothetical protein [Patescibacteria group bacterium]